MCVCVIVCINTYKTSQHLFSSAIFIVNLICLIWYGGVWFQIGNQEQKTLKTLGKHQTLQGPLNSGQTLWVFQA